MAKRQNNSTRTGKGSHFANKSQNGNPKEHPKTQKNDVTEGAQGKQRTTSSVRDTKTSPIAVKELPKQTKKTVVPTQEQISERAKVIWKQRGCISGEDQRNWFEAEHQLQEEMSRT